jgi:hypothetical protein
MRVTHIVFFEPGERSCMLWACLVISFFRRFNERLYSRPISISAPVRSSYRTLSGKDLDRIHRHQRDSNRFGFAVQICLLRFPGWQPHYLQQAMRAKEEASEPIPEHVLAHLAPLDWKHITLTGPITDGDTVVIFSCLSVCFYPFRHAGPVCAHVSFPDSPCI